MDFTKLPIGFAMALAMNEPALQKFGRLTESERQSIVSQARAARSESEMHRLVSGIAGDNTMQ